MPASSAESAPKGAPISPAKAEGEEGHIPEPGELVGGKYRIDGTIAKGGMAVVLAATHEGSGLAVAVKVLQPQFAASHELRERFVREARALGALTSRHILRVFDVGTLASGEAYLVLERLEGNDMHDILQRDGPLHWRRAVNYILQACEGLREAHAHGVLHRDLKPSNMFLAKDGESECIKLLDFGLAKLKEDGVSGLTGGEVVMGSPSYMPPEQIKGLTNADERSDVWALGVSLYELLTDGYPFEGTSPTKIAAEIIMKEPIPLRNRAAMMPPGLEDTIMACLVKDPEKRIGTSEQLIARLRPFLDLPNEPLPLATVKPKRSLHLDTQATLVAGATPRGELDVDDVDDNASTQLLAAADAPPTSRRGDRHSLDQAAIATLVRAPRPEAAITSVYRPREGADAAPSPYAADTSMREARAQYFRANRFPDDGGYDDAWVNFKLGPIPFPFPNTPARKRAVRVHDLHHIVTGYMTTLVGEFEISAWELGAGCADYFAAWQLNLGGIFGGLLIAPRKTFRAFVRGRRSASLYGREDLELLLEKQVGEVRSMMHVPRENPRATAGDVAWFVLAEMVGAIAALMQLGIGLVFLPFGLLFAALGKGKRKNA